MYIIETVLNASNWPTVVGSRTYYVRKVPSGGYRLTPHRGMATKFPTIADTQREGTECLSFLTACGYTNLELVNVRCDDVTDS